LCGVEQPNQPLLEGSRFKLRVSDPACQVHICC
jgi:hypothetical protein